MDHTIIPIRKMHCHSCELLLERTLLRIPAIERAKVSYRRSRAIIHSKGTLDLERVREAIEAAGYEVGESERRLLFTRDTDEYGYLAIGAIILAGLYVLASRTNLLQISASAGADGGLLTSLFIGLTAGISTCMALVGGLILSVAARHAEKHPEASTLQKFRPHLFFNIGRIAAFFILGGILGSLGGFLTISSMMLGILMMLIAIVMILLGAQLTEIFPALNAYKFALPAALARALGIHRHHAQEYSHRNAAALGALTFFLPCGFTQLMQVNAVASGGFLPGALLMGAFAVGTAPGLLGVGGLTSVVSGFGAKIFFKTAGLLVIALAVFNFANGYRLTGFASPWESPERSVVADDTSAPIEDGFQLVRMQQTWDGYEPNTFVLRRGIPVRWIVDSTAPGSCAASIVVPTLGITRYFDPGENVIEFTPTETGTIRFSCAMGMYPGSFTVIDGAGQI